MLAESCASVSVILKLNKEFIFQLPARVILISWNKQIHKSPTPNQKLTTGPTGQGEGAARTTPWPRTAAGQGEPSAGGGAEQARGQQARKGSASSTAWHGAACSQPPDERDAATGRLRSCVPVPAIHKSEEKQAGRVEGSLGIQFCRSEGEEEDRRRVIAKGRSLFPLRFEYRQRLKLMDNIIGPRGLFWPIRPGRSSTRG